MTDIPEGFTPHDGDGCPVSHDTFVEVVFKGGEEIHAAPAGSLYGRFDWWNWLHEDMPNDDKIIAYRVVKP